MTKGKVTSKRSRTEKEEVQSLTSHRRRRRHPDPLPVPKTRTHWNKSLLFRGPVNLDLFQAHRRIELDEFARQLMDMMHLRETVSIEVAKRRPSLLPPLLRRFSQKKTLVLDIDETLVHSELDPTETETFDFVFQVVTQYTSPKRVGLRKRPFVEEFLAWCGENFELVTFTSSIKQYADQVIDWLDPERKYVKYRLYREACTCFGEEYYLKNLEQLRRDLNGVLLVDNSPIAFAFHLDNGIPIEGFYGEEQSHTDIELLKLKNFLENLLSVEDVRPTIRNTFKLHEMAQHLKKLDAIHTP